MQANTKKQVILITGDHSKCYEQAIFILRRGHSAQELQRDFIGEAEEIVRAYLHGGPSTSGATRPHIKRKRQPLDIALNIMLLVTCIALAAMMIAQMI